jgi:hypothetical protein
VHDRGAEAAHDPDSHAGIRARMEIVEILDEREPGPHGEACDRRIHEETDPVRPDEREDDEPLEQLLEDR